MSNMINTSSGLIQSIAAKLQGAGMAVTPGGMAANNVVGSNAAPNMAVPTVIDQASNNTVVANPSGGSVSTGPGVVQVETRQQRVTGENNNIQFNVTNSGATNDRLIIGGLLAFSGSYFFYAPLGSGALAPSACDNPKVSDQNGSGVLAIQGFSAMINLSPVVVGQVQVNSSTVAQQNPQMTLIELAYDFTQTLMIINTQIQQTRFDTNNLVTKQQNPYILGPNNMIVIPTVAGAFMNLVITITSAHTSRSMRHIGDVTNPA